MMGCFYKKVYFNWKIYKVEKCMFCYLWIEEGELIVCVEICVGWIWYIGVMLYDVDWVEEVVEMFEED